MKRILAGFVELYERSVLRQPVATLAVITASVLGGAWHAQYFALDASSDSLVLENDQALDYYRAIRARYGSDDYLIVTYTPERDLFSDAALDDLAALRDALRAMQNVEAVTSILDVPLIMSPPARLGALEEGIRRLEDPHTDRKLARAELLSSPLYRDLIISDDAQTTAMTVSFRVDEEHRRLREERDALREQRFESPLEDAEEERLEEVTRAYDESARELAAEQSDDLAMVRSILDRHRDTADLHVGGVPMIVVDSMEFIRSDMLIFGTAVFTLLVLVLGTMFKKWRWTVLPLVTCVAACVILIGLLGLLRWRVTVVSSNFVSLVLILCLSLTLHFIVRYRELHVREPDADQFSLVSATARKIATPCLYNALTTIVAFGSLLVSGIRPVINFGLMMSVGVFVAFVLTFTLFPAALMLMPPREPRPRNDLTARITGFFAESIRHHSTLTLALSAALVLAGALGTTRLTVENRFIDYFRKSTEIYQGMELIDRKLGGTTPLDVIIDAPAAATADVEAPAGGAEEDGDEFIDVYVAHAEGSGGFTAQSYWYNSRRLPDIMAMHDYLDDLPDTGKVISLATAARMLAQLDPEILDDNLELSILYDKLPDAVRRVLIEPYLSDGGDQLRLSVRVFESDPGLRRNALLEQIRSDLRREFGLDGEQVHLSGMLVLYNNMLRSLFSSQIQTLGAVFAAIMLMFLLLFASLRIALIAIVPTAASACVVLGLMGWLDIPLDLMTITIAAITVGIGVDDTIHYVHRFRREFAADGNYWDAVMRSHRSIGRAMYYTSITVMLGFSILVLSRFVPTIYFGLLTTLAMAIALLANIALLPVLIVRCKAMGPGTGHGASGHGSYAR